MSGTNEVQKGCNAVFITAMVYSKNEIPNQHPIQ